MPGSTVTYMKEELCFFEQGLIMIKSENERESEVKQKRSVTLSLSHSAQFCGSYWIRTSDFHPVKVTL